MSGQTLAWSEVIMASRCVWSGSVLLVLLSPVLSSSHLHPASTYPLGSLHHQPLNPVYNNGMPSVWKSFSECVINFDCSSDKVCVNKKCQDPCPSLCGVNAYCNVRSHVPVCTCNAGFLGNPFTSCYRPATTTPRPKTSDASVQVLVESMPSADREMEQPRAAVTPGSRVTHTWPAHLSVSHMRTVRPLNCAETSIAMTRARVSVAPMHTASLVSITSLCVFVTRDTLEIH